MALQCDPLPSLSTSLGLDGSVHSFCGLDKLKPTRRDEWVYRMRRQWICQLPYTARKARNLFVSHLFGCASHYLSVSLSAYVYPLMGFCLPPGHTVLGKSFQVQPSCIRLEQVRLCLVRHYIYLPPLSLPSSQFPFQSCFAQKVSLEFHLGNMKIASTHCANRIDCLKLPKLRVVFNFAIKRETGILRKIERVREGEHEGVRNTHLTPNEIFPGKTVIFHEIRAPR